MSGRNWLYCKDCDRELQDDDPAQYCFRCFRARERRRRSPGHDRRERRGRSRSPGYDRRERRERSRSPLYYDEHDRRSRGDRTSPRHHRQRSRSRDRRSYYNSPPRDEGRNNRPNHGQDRQQAPQSGPPAAGSAAAGPAAGSQRRRRRGPPNVPAGPPVAQAAAAGLAVFCSLCHYVGNPNHVTHMTSACRRLGIEERRRALHFEGQGRVYRLTPARMTQLDTERVTQAAHAAQQQAANQAARLAQQQAANQAALAAQQRTANQGQVAQNAAQQGAPLSGTAPIPQPLVAQNAIVQGTVPQGDAPTTTAGAPPAAETRQFRHAKLEDSLANVRNPARLDAMIQQLQLQRQIAAARQAGSTPTTQQSDDIPADGRPGHNPDATQDDVLPSPEGRRDETTTAPQAEQANVTTAAAETGRGRNNAQSRARAQSQPLEFDQQSLELEPSETPTEQQGPASTAAHFAQSPEQVEAEMAREHSVFVTTQPIGTSPVAALEAHLQVYQDQGRRALTGDRQALDAGHGQRTHALQTMLRKARQAAK